MRRPGDWMTLRCACSGVQPKTSGRASQFLHNASADLFSSRACRRTAAKAPGSSRTLTRKAQAAETMPNNQRRDLSALKSLSRTSSSVLHTPNSSKNATVSASASGRPWSSFAPHTRAAFSPSWSEEARARPPEECRVSSTPAVPCFTEPRRGGGSLSSLAKSPLDEKVENCGAKCDSDGVDATRKQRWPAGDDACATYVASSDTAAQRRSEPLTSCRRPDCSMRKHYQAQLQPVVSLHRNTRLRCQQAWKNPRKMHR